MRPRSAAMRKPSSSSRDRQTVAVIGRPERKNFITEKIRHIRHVARFVIPNLAQRVMAHAPFQAARHRLIFAGHFTGGQILTRGDVNVSLNRAYQLSSGGRWRPFGSQPPMSPSRARVMATYKSRALPAGLGAPFGLGRIMAIAQGGAGAP